MPVIPNLEIYDQNRIKVAVLENAYQVWEDETLNGLNYLGWTLPAADPKNQFCLPLFYCRYNNGQLYRIMTNTLRFNEKGDIKYKAEHVLGMLIDDVLIDTHQYGGINNPTPAVLQYILSQQEVKHWILGKVDFNHRFEYGWTDESLLSALFSVPKHFTDDYMWTTDTDSYPFRLNLIKLNKNINPQMYIRPRKNALKIIHQSDASNIYTRVYPRGYGEGINTLKIDRINNGKEYVESPPEIIKRYGIRKFFVRDRRFTTRESLKDYALAVLHDLQTPYEQYQTQFANLGFNEFDQPAIGKWVEIVGFKRSFIVKIRWNYDELPKSDISIANKPKDIASNIAHMLNRQRIEASYSLGVTQFWQNHWYDNADQHHPLQLRVFIPQDLRIINFVRMDVHIGPFRMPFRVTQGGGAIVNVQTAGGNTDFRTATVQSATASVNETTANVQNTIATVQNTTADVQNTIANVQSTIATVQTTAAAVNRRAVVITAWNSPSITVGGTTTTNIWGGQDRAGFTLGSGEPMHVHEMGMHRHTTTITIPERSFDHDHTSPAHGHTGISHGHTGNPHGHTGVAHGHTGISHGHTGIAHGHTGIAHGHTGIAHDHAIPNMFINIPNHSHQLEPGMALSGNPTSFTVRINGVNRQTVTGRNLDRIITEWLFNENNEVRRNWHHLIEIIPNEPAYVMLTANIQGFIQPQGGIVA